MAVLVCGRCRAGWYREHEILDRDAIEHGVQVVGLRHQKTEHQHAGSEVRGRVRGVERTVQPLEVRRTRRRCVPGSGRIYVSHGSSFAVCGLGGQAGLSLFIEGYRGEPANGSELSRIGRSLRTVTMTSRSCGLAR